MPRWLSAATLWTSPILITGGIAAFGVFVNLVRLENGGKRPGWPIVAAAIALWVLHVGYLLGPWLWGRGRLALGLWLTIPVALVALCFWVFFLGRLVFADPGANPDITHRVRWGLGLMAGALAYGGPIVVWLAAGETWMHRAVSSPAFAWTLSILLNLASAAASLCMVVMLLAGGANSTEAQILVLKRLIIAVSLVGVAGVGGGVWALLAGRHWLSVGLGGAPLVFVIVLMAVLVKIRF